MPRQRSPNRDKAFKIYKEHKGNITLREIANILSEDEKKIAVWKQRDKWNDNSNVVQQKNKRCTTNKNKNISWIKIENEYVTDIRKKPCTLESLSKKYNIPFKTIEDYSYRNKWSEKRGNYQGKVRDKTIEKSTKIQVDRNLKYLDVSDMALDAIEEYFKSKDYKKHIIKYKIYVDGKPDSEELVSKKLDVADTKALANMVTSLEKLQKGQRLAEGLDIENTTSNVNVNLKEENSLTPEERRKRIDELIAKRRK